MVYNILRIMRDVRIAIDENKASDQLITDEDIDTLALNEIVESKITEATRRVLTEAPIELLDGGVNFGDAVFWREKGAGWILLPCDFMRLLVFKMSDWERPVYEAISAANPEYKKQHSRYKGIRGNPQKPVVALTIRQEGRVLELYSCKSDKATVEQALYLPLPRIDEDGGIEIPERCYESIVYMTAALVLATIGQGELSGTMAELSKQLIT